MEPGADFQKVNCHSEQYGTCLVSEFIPCVVDLLRGGVWDRRRGAHYSGHL